MPFFHSFWFLFIESVPTISSLQKAMLNCQAESLPGF